MPTKKATKTTAKNKVQRANDYKALYFNHAQVGHTAFDIFAVLGEASIDPSSEVIVIEQRARITTTPAEALLLARFLINAVKQWEQNTGLKVQMPNAEKDPTE